MPGLDLSERFFHELIEPALAERLPAFRYSAALIGPGSEVLGFDTSMSTDHSWGPRVQLFMPTEGVDDSRLAIQECLESRFPTEFGGYPLTFPTTVEGSHAVQAVTIPT